MLKYGIILLSTLVISCQSTRPIFNEQEKINYSNIQSEFVVADTNNYGCKPVDESVLKHVLKTGKPASAREIHDYYSVVGCSIEGSLFKDNIQISFTFDYGGIIYFDNGDILACGEECCADGFEYCTWDDSQFD